MPIVCANGFRQSNSPHNRFCSGPTNSIHRSRCKPSGRERRAGMVGEACRLTAPTQPLPGTRVLAPFWSVRAMRYLN